MTFKTLLAATAVATMTVATPASVLASPAQFPDVEPTNWAYEAILNLRDKYGCAKGFPDRTFRARQPATRAELAALTNACLDEISNYIDQKDAALAAALRAEIGKLDSRVVKLEVAEQAKNARVGPYIGAGVSVLRRPDDGFSDNNSNSNLGVGGTIQGRLPLLKSGAVNAVSIRPFVTFTSDNSFSRVLGGATVTYDLSVARTTLLDGSQVSKANIYAGLGGIWSSRDTFASKDSDNKGSSGTGLGVIGYEARLSPSLVGFADVKFPFQSTRDSVTGKTNYSPIGTVGIGWKF